MRRRLIVVPPDGFPAHDSAGEGAAIMGVAQASGLLSDSPGDEDLTRQLSFPALFVDLDIDEADPARARRFFAAAGERQLIVVALSRHPDLWGEIPIPADVLLTDVADAPAPWVSCDLARAVAAIAAVTREFPVASLAFTELLRIRGALSMRDAITAESFAFSMLQGSDEFAGWLAAHPKVEPYEQEEPAVLGERVGDRLIITLNRPGVRNAVNTDVRDRLVELFGLALLDRSITEIVVRGSGRSFCSGGDLSEFGSMTDPGSGHRVRLARSMPMVIAACADRTTVEVHGLVVGAGLELAAFGRTVIARAGTRFALPELSMGLIPGAGGTASIPERIGRQRTAYLGLSNRWITAATAFEWGLVDEVVGRSPTGEKESHPDGVWQITRTNDESEGT